MNMTLTRIACTLIVRACNHTANLFDDIADAVESWHNAHTDTPRPTAPHGPMDTVIRTGTVDGLNIVTFNGPPPGMSPMLINRGGHPAASLELARRYGAMRT